MQNKDYSEAREWARQVMDNPGYTSPFMQTVAKTLLDLLPKMTMAELEWEHDLHHLAGATTPDGKEVVMMWLDDVESGLVMCDNAGWEPSRLTPNGKQYKLVEATVSSNENVGPDQPEHPTVLETEQDFEDAPEGTIVTKRGCGPWVLLENGMWVTTSAEYPSGRMTITAPYTVLRWGWGE